jgi:hypothetical protein
MENYNLTYATFEQSRDKILECTHEKSKSAEMLRNYLLSVNKIKFGMRPVLKSMSIGAQRREKWSQYVKKIYDVKAIVPFVSDLTLPKQETKTLVRKIFSKQSVMLNYEKFPMLEEAKDNLKQAEINKRADVLKQRQANKIARQKIIDFQNAENIRNYNELVEKKIEEYKKTVDDMTEEEEKRVVDKITFERCLPDRIDEYNGKYLNERVEITVTYKNGYRRSLKAIKNPSSQEKEECFSCDIPTMPEYSYSTFMYGDFKNPYYFKIQAKDIVQKKAQMSYANAVEKFKKENPEPKKILDAKTETTGSILLSASCSSLGIPRRSIKKQIPQTEEIKNALQSIKEWTVVHGRHKADVRKKFIEKAQDEFISHNKYAVLQNHHSCVEVHRLANYKKSEVCKRDENGAPVITKKEKNKRKLIRREIRKKDKIESMESKKNPITGPNINFKNLILMIVNSQLFKEEKIRQENQFTGEAFDAYLQKGFLTKNDCYLSKKQRGVLKRILDDLFMSILVENS